MKKKMLLCGCLTVSLCIVLLGCAVGMHANVEANRLEAFCAHQGRPDVFPRPLECSYLERRNNALRAVANVGFAVAGIAARGSVCILALGSFWLSLEAPTQRWSSPRLPTHLLRGMHLKDGPGVDDTMSTRSDTVTANSVSDHWRLHHPMMIHHAP